MTDELLRDEITKEILGLMGEVTDMKVVRQVYYLLWRGTLPEAAPEKYMERNDKKENVVDFVQRVYGKWLTGEFTKADLRKLDSKVMRALDNWERYHPGESLPFRLPAIGDFTKQQYLEDGATRNELVKRWDRVNRVARNKRSLEI